MSSPNAEQTHDETRPASVLRILSGLHAGASRELAEQEMILVGSGDDCDIVLADHGVARHHALLNLTAGMSSLRALDAPLRVDGQPLHPGDPVELGGLQRIQLGDAAIAFGDEDDPGWEALLPDAAELRGQPRATGGGMRRLPVIAALAVLSLASLAIFAAVMPTREPPPDVRAQLDAVVRDFRISDARVHDNVNGEPVLTGTVRDAATRARILQYLREKKIEAPPPELRSGEDIAADVGEVLRSQGVSAKTRYLGGGIVEATGRFEDMEKLRVAVQSRAMDDVPGVRKVLPNNTAPPPPPPDAKPSPANAPADAAVRIVRVVRGENAHVVAVDGTEYRPGDDVPGLGRLSAIGESAQAIDAQGVIHKIVPKPVTAEELAAAVERQAATDASAGQAPQAQANAGADPAATPPAATRPASANGSTEMPATDQRLARARPEPERQ
jgi:hypothetical protein